MFEPLDESYFNWLCAKVLLSNIYLDLLRILYSTEFVWVVAGDRNRAEDGLELRQDFLRETRLSYEPEWADAGCSVLEMLVYFSKRAWFQTEISEKVWFQKFLENLGLDQFRRISDADVPAVEHILSDFVWRTYDRKGRGGLFPVFHSRNDQRKVEVWYQFCEYVEEQGLV